VKSATDGNAHRSLVGDHDQGKLGAHRVAERALVDVRELRLQQGAQLGEGARPLPEQGARHGQQLLQVQPLGALA
jgi:hypothetical protein